MESYAIDAFTYKDQAGTGNHHLVLFDTDSLSDDQMLAIAKETNLAETIFVRKTRSENEDVHARYWTTTSEIPLAGSPTISLISAIVHSGRISASERQTIRLGLKAGIIEVEYDPSGKIVMTQLKPVFHSIVEPSSIAPCFGISEKDILGTPQIVSTGTPQLMVQVASLEALRDIQVDKRNLPPVTEPPWYTVHFFVVNPSEFTGALTFARDFMNPNEADVEDTFTGSATGAMAAYIAKYHLAPMQSGVEWTAQQGHWMKRPGEAGVIVDYTENDGERDITKVRVGGKAVLAKRSRYPFP